MPITYQRGKTTAGVTTITSTWADLTGCVIAAENLEPSTQYFILASAWGASTEAGALNHVIFRVAAAGAEITGADYSQALFNMGQTTGTRQLWYLRTYTTPAEPVAVSLQHSNRESDGTITSHGVIIMIKASDLGVADTDYHYSETAADTNPTSTPTVRDSITFTALNKPYVILSMFKWDASNTFFQCNSRIQIDGTEFSHDSFEPESTVEEQQCISATVQTLAAGDRTIETEVSMENAAGGQICKFSSLLIFPLDLFGDPAAFWDAAEVNPALDDWNQVATLAHTPAAAGDFLCLAKSTKDNNGGAQGAYRMQVDGVNTLTGDDVTIAASRDSTDENSLVKLDVVSLSAVAHTIDADYDPNQAGGAARIEDNLILVLGPIGASPETAGGGPIPSIGAGLASPVGAKMAGNI